MTAARLAIALALAPLATTGPQNPQEPVLLADIHTGPSNLLGAGGSAPDPITESGTRLVFGAAESLFSRALWIWDLSLREPQRIALDEETNPIGIVALPTGRLVYSALDAQQSKRVLGTDGTPAGTVRLFEADTDQNLQLIAGPLAWRDRAWYVTQEFGSPLLYSTDGTLAGTRLEDAFAAPPWGLGRDLFLVAGDKLYVGVGTPGSGDRLVVLSQPGQPALELAALGEASSGLVTTAIEFQGGLAFTGMTTAGGAEPWITDGTLAGTRILLDVEVGPQGSDVHFLAADAQRLWFAPRKSGIGRELWLSDGTAAGTGLVLDARPGAGDGVGLGGGAIAGSGALVYSGFRPGFPAGEPELRGSDGTAAGSFPLGPDEPEHFAVLNGEVFCSATGPGLGREPWRSDGTLAGTQILADIAPGSVGSNPVLFTALGELWFQANDGSAGPELWASDGTAAGTRLEANLAPDLISKDSNPAGLLRFGDEVYFGANSEQGWGLWASDGTPAGTREVLGPDTTPGGLSWSPGIELGGRLLLAFDSPDPNGGGSLGSELWSTDGTTAGTSLVADLEPGAVGSGPRSFVRLGAGSVFAAHSVKSYPYFTTGTGSGTVQLTSSWANLNVVDLVDSAEINGRLVFTWRDAESGYEAWATDGTPGGTLRLADLKSGSSSSAPGFYCRLGEHVYFAANSDEHGSELFRTNGTVSGTELAVDLVPGSVGGQPRELTRVGQRMLFTAAITANAGRELWITDGTAAGTSLVSSLHAGPAAPGANPRLLSPYAGGVALVGGEPEFLWVTDGTPAGTIPVPAPAAGPIELLEQGPLRSLGGTAELLFAGREFATGFELWRWPGPGFEPVPLPEVAPGPNGAGPGELVVVGSSLVFDAFRTTVGREPFAQDLTSFGAFGAEPFGFGCALGVAPSIAHTGSAGIGQALGLELAEAPPGALALAFFGPELAVMNLGQGCTLYMGAPKFLGLTTVGADGLASLTVGIPSVPGLVGQDFAVQWLIAQAGGPWLGSWALSNGLDLVPGP